jgi:hypothetical protein
MIVTAGTFVSQCAEMHKIARGFGNFSPYARHAREYFVSSIAFMGLPCPMNAAGHKACMLPAILATLLLAQTQPGCSGADPAIVSAAVQGVTPSGGLNIYHIVGTVENLGHAKQASSMLQFVEIYFDRNKVDTRGIPPLAPGGKYSFGYDFKRATDAADGSSHIRFQLSFRQPTPPGSQDCSAGNDVYRLTF